MYKIAFIMGMFSLSMLGAATTLQNQNQQKAQNQQPSIQAIPQALYGSVSKAAGSWLSLIDKEQYADSWKNGSDLFRQRMTSDSWGKIMEQNRKPLGKVSSRIMMDQAIMSKDPEGLPKGDYMVLFYNTAFANKPKGVEIIYLRDESGIWKVLEYKITQLPTQ